MDSSAASGEDGPLAVGGFFVEPQGDLQADGEDVRGKRRNPK